MSISTSLPHDVRIETILHRVGRRRANASTRRIPANDERIYLHRNQLTRQRCPKEGATELLLNHQLRIPRSTGLVPGRIIPERVADIETRKGVRELLLVPVAAGFGMMIHYPGEDDGDRARAAEGYQVVGGCQGGVEAIGGVEGAGRGEVGVADVDDEEGGIGAEGEFEGGGEA